MNILILKNSPSLVFGIMISLDMLCNASYHERLILLAQYNTACFYISEEKNKKLHYQICKKWPVFFFSFVHSAYMQDIQHLQRQIYIYVYQPGLHQDMRKYEAQRQSVFLFARRWQFVRRQLAISAEIYGKSVALWKLYDFTTLCCPNNLHWARENIANNVIIQFPSRILVTLVW